MATSTLLLLGEGMWGWPPLFLRQEKRYTFKKAKEERGLVASIVITPPKKERGLVTSILTLLLSGAKEMATSILLILLQGMWR